MMKKRRIISIILSLVLLVCILPLPYGTVSYAVTDISTADLPPYPGNGQKYWVIFTEGFRDERVEMTTCDISGDDKNAYIVWDRNLLLHGADVEGKYNQYYLNDEGNWEQIGSYPRFTDYAVSVIASNLDIYDSDGNKILSRMEGYGAQTEENGDELGTLFYEQYKALCYSKNVSMITEGYMTYSEIESNYTPTVYALDNMLSFGWNKRFGFTDDAQIWETILIDILLKKSYNSATVADWEKSVLEYSKECYKFIQKNGINDFDTLIDIGNKERIEKIAAELDMKNQFIDSKGKEAIGDLINAAGTIRDFVEKYAQYVQLRKTVCEDTVVFLKQMQNTENYERIPAFHRALDALVKGLTVDCRDLVETVIKNDLPGVLIPKAINECLGMVAKKLLPTLDLEGVVDFSVSTGIFLMEALCGTDELAEVNVYLYIVDCIDTSAKEAFRTAASDCIRSDGKNSYRVVNGGLDFIIDISAYGVGVCREWNDIISMDILARMETVPYINVNRPHYDMANSYLDLGHASSNEEKKAFIEKKCKEDERYIETVLKNQEAYAAIQWYGDTLEENGLGCLLLFKVENPDATTTLYAQTVPKYTEISFPELEKKSGYLTPAAWYTDAACSNEAEDVAIATESRVFYTKYRKNILFEHRGSGGLRVISLSSPNARNIRFLPQWKEKQLAGWGVYVIPPYIEGYRVEELGDDIFRGYSEISAVSIPGTVIRISENSFASLPDDVLYQYVKGSYAETYMMEKNYINTEPTLELYFEEETVILAAGDRKQLNILQSGSCETDRIVWKSTDDSIVTVDDSGGVTAVKDGEAVITASSASLSASCRVIVNVQGNGNDAPEPSVLPELPVASVTPEPLETPAVSEAPTGPLATPEPLQPTDTQQPDIISNPSGSSDNLADDGTEDMESQPVMNRKKTVPKKGKIVKVGTAKYIIVKSAKKNGTVAFYGTKKGNAAKIILPDTVKINGYTFKVTAIHRNAFKDMKELKDVKLGKNVKTIGNNAFRNCKKLHFIILPKKVSTIGRNAFAGSGLKYLLVRSDKLKTVGAGAFQGTGRNMTVKTPKAKWRQYAKKFQGKGEMSGNAVFLIEPVKLKYNGKSY